MTINSTKETAMTVRLDRWNVVVDADRVVVFDNKYEGNPNFPALGQQCEAYNASTFMAITDGRRLAMNCSIPAWTLDASEVAAIKDVIEVVRYRTVAR